VYTWGFNDQGQLGDGTEDTDRLIPVKVLMGAYSGTTYLGDDSNNKITAVEMGGYHAIAIAADGTVYCWGWNGNGELGNNSTAQSNIPVKVLKGAYSGTTYLGDDSNNKITAVALAAFHSIALAADGTVYSWGWNNCGQLGNNSTTQSNIPVKVLKGAYSGTTYLGDDSNNKITAVASATYQCIALAADGTVYSWGLNDYGQLGDGTEDTNRLTPVKVLKGAYSGTTYLGDDSNNKITAVALGALHSVALDAEGAVYSWGWNASGQLGDNTTTQRNTAIKVNGIGGAGDLSLPVELSSFTASVNRSGEVLLSWVTESEIENLGFILERRQESAPWLEIASYLTHPKLLGQGSVSYRTEYFYTDNSVESGHSYDYRLADVSYDGVKEYYALTVVGLTVNQSMSDYYHLSQAYPNPFNPTTTISYDLPEQVRTKLTVFDIRGQEILTLQDASQAAGNYEVQWNGMDQSGNQVRTSVYFCRLRAGSYSKTIKMVYLR